MKLIWSTDAWEDYLFWQDQDKKLLKRINSLIKQQLPLRLKKLCQHWDLA